MRAKKQITSDNKTVRVGGRQETWICPDCRKYNEPTSLTCLCGFSFYRGHNLESAQTIFKGIII
jgi:hypothetical protein